MSVSEQAVYTAIALFRTLLFAVSECCIGLVDLEGLQSNSAPNKEVYCCFCRIAVALEGRHVLAQLRVKKNNNFLIIIRHFPPTVFP